MSSGQEIQEQAMDKEFVHKLVQKDAYCSSFLVLTSDITIKEIAQQPNDYQNCSQIKKTNFIRENDKYEKKKPAKCDLVWCEFHGNKRHRPDLNRESQRDWFSFRWALRPPFGAALRSCFKTSAIPGYATMAYSGFIGNSL